MTEHQTLPMEYERTRKLDELRATEYAHLDRDGQVYLDYAGAGVYAATQVQAHLIRVRSGSYGNPHSENPTSRASSDLVESARRAVLAHLNASPDEYAVIFTPNATSACRLVGEAYPFGRGRRFVLTFDNHNSVNGIREYAKMRRARVQYVPVVPPELRIDSVLLRRELGKGRGLFAFPAQSNFSGVQHPLEWIDIAHEHGYDVLLDAAAYLATNRLDLSVVHPDFVPVSWYKLFGYPTGVGCLVARREALTRLRRPWFSGGTIRAVSVMGDWHQLMDDETAFEDGTLNFLGIPDVEFGLSWMDSIGLDLVHTRVQCLTGWLLNQLPRLRHSNGRPMVRVYGPLDTHARGGTVAFNLLDPDGALVDERLIAAESAAQGFSLRSGCFCNPGAAERAFNLTRGKLRASSQWRIRTVDEFLQMMGLPTGGAVRVSFGLASTFTDAERFIDFLDRTYRDRRTSTGGLAPRIRC